MPELPEVEVIVRELKECLPGEELSNIRIEWHKTFVNDVNEPPIGRKIIDIDRKGKYIIFCLDQYYLITHLRMTGQFIVNTTNSFEQKHLRVKFNFKSGLNLLYYDARKFGRIYFTQDLNKIFKNIGIDALDPELTKEKFFRLISNRNSIIKSYLLNQKFIAGIGNIYCDESLFKAGIHPGRKINKISKENIFKLNDSIHDTLISSMKNMGTTISDYKTTGGGFGNNQNYLHVYNREGEPCFICNSIINKIRLAGRGTYFCPNCQK